MNHHTLNTIKVNSSHGTSSLCHMHYALCIALALMFLLLAPNAEARKKQKKGEPEVALLVPDKEAYKYKAMPDTHFAPKAEPRIMHTRYGHGKPLHGIDISHHQGTINWSETAKDPKAGYVYIKATEGRDHVDDTYAFNVREARRYGLKVGAYHFFRPNVSAADQFRNFTGIVDKKKQDLIPLVDVEVTGGVAVSTMLVRLEELLQMLTREYGVKPLIYTGRNFYNKYIGPYSQFKGYKFMIAQYTTDEPVLMNDDDYVIWQYTGHGSIRGIRGSVDQSCFHGYHTISEILYK